MNWHRLMRIFGIITCCGAYIMLLLGVIVTSTDSGQGCGGTWPFCHGELVPAFGALNTVFEYSHRVSASVDGTLILVLSVWSFLAYRSDFRVKLLAAMSLFFVVLQGALGAVTVVYEGTFAKYPLLALHFGFSLISFSSVVLLTVRLFQCEREQRYGPQKVATAGKGLQYAAWGLAACTYLVVYTGALVQHTGAVLGCGMQFPGCGATYFPSLTSLAGVQMLHRFAASSIWLLLLVFLVMVVRRYRGRADVFVAACCAFVLVTLQAASGIATVFSSGVLMWGLVHTTIISAFFTVLCYLCLQVGWPWQKQRQGQARIAIQEDEKEKELQKGYA